LTREEWGELVADCDRFRNLKHSSVLPNVFTEHGAVMVANILHSRQAVDMSVYVVRAFVELRAALSKDVELIQKITSFEK